jgi:hypothetical protein
MLAGSAQHNANIQQAKGVVCLPPSYPKSSKGSLPMSGQNNLNNERQVILPSGRISTVREGRGRDLINAQRAVGRTAESSALLQALVAMLCTLDGKDLVYEDVLEMPVADVLMLEAEVLGNFPVAQASLPAPHASLPSPTLQASPDSSISALAPANSAK